MSIINVDSKSFDSTIDTGVVLVDFYATWCGPCKMLSPIIDEVSNEISDVKFVKVDVDNSNDLANKYGITSIPTLLLFKDKKLKGKTVGFLTKDDLIRFINENK